MSLSVSLALRQLVRLAWWHATSLAAKTSFYFCPCNCCNHCCLLLPLQLGRLAKCRSRGLCAAPGETMEWRVKSGQSANLRDRVQPGSQPARQPVARKLAHLLQVSLACTLSRCYLGCWLAPQSTHTHIHKPIPTIPTRDQLNLNRLPACLSDCLSHCLSACPLVHELSKLFII